MRLQTADKSQREAQKEKTLLPLPRNIRCRPTSSRDRLKPSLFFLRKSSVCLIESLPFVALLHCLSVVTHLPLLLPPTRKRQHSAQGVEGGGWEAWRVLGAGRRHGDGPNRDTAKLPPCLWHVPECVCPGGRVFRLRRRRRYLRIIMYLASRDEAWHGIRPGDAFPSFLSVLVLGGEAQRIQRFKQTRFVMCLKCILVAASLPLSMY